MRSMLRVPRRHRVVAEAVLVADPAVGPVDDQLRLISLCDPAPGLRRRALREVGRDLLKAKFCWPPSGHMEL